LRFEEVQTDKEVVLAEHELAHFEVSFPEIVVGENEVFCDIVESDLD
jgi:hypothetical protein